MTLPASGAIAMSNFNVELGQASTYSGSMSWVKSLTKAAQVSNSFNGYYSKAYYQRNADGNCNNGNCASAGGNCTFQCTNCTLATVNCANCDAQKWLQNNCNCACTYNCTQVANVLYDCNCNCQCSTCFPAGAMVLMADGSLKAIETVGAGEFVMGADGKPAEVQYLHVATLGTRKMYIFAEDNHEWSDEHLYWVLKDGKEWWWSINPDQWRWEVASGGVAGLKDNYSILTGDGYAFGHLDGWVNRTPVRVDRPSDTEVYLPITLGIPVIVNGYVVTGGTNQELYDYNSFRWNPNNIAAKE